MAVTSIIRAKGATRERTVQLFDIRIYDIRSAFLADAGPDWEEWMEAVEKFYEDLGMLLGAARAQVPLPAEFYVPDLWHSADRLRPEERDTTLDMWSLGHDLARGLGYLHSGDIYDGGHKNVVGARYLLGKELV